MIPNVLHKIWIGETCPPMQDLLSLLAATVFLQPSTIKYHVGKDVPALSTCTGFGMLFANRSFQQLAIDETALPKQLKLAAHKADAHRAMVLHQYGGWFLDGDAFVVSRDVQRYRRCRVFVLGTEHDRAKPPRRADGRPNIANNDSWSGKLNNGAMLAPPGTSFGKDWLRYMRTGSWRKGVNNWDYASCVWPTEYMARHPSALIGALDVRTFPWRKFGWDPSLGWDWPVRALVEAGATILHVTDGPPLRPLPLPHPPHTAPSPRYHPLPASPRAPTAWEEACARCDAE